MSRVITALVALVVLAVFWRRKPTAFTPDVGSVSRGTVNDHMRWIGRRGYSE